jgi:hypothetical protein
LWVAPRKIGRMSPTPPDRGPVRSAAEVNAEIRALVAAGGAGTGRYEELLEEWAAAMRADVRPAA